MSHTSRLRAASVLACALLLTAGCARKPLEKMLAGPTMGTSYHVTIIPHKNDDEQQARHCIDSVLADVDAHLSTYNSASEVSALNRNASGEWVPLSESLFTVLTAAARVSAASSGAFDVTVAPAVDLWGFGPARESEATKSGQEPTPVAEPMPADMDAAMVDVGFRMLELRAAPTRAYRKLRPSLRVDLNGIAPGYAVDRICSCLERQRIGDYLVEIGGEVRGHGHRNDGLPWRVAVETPLVGERTPYVGVPLTNMAVSTSGDYRDFRITAQGARISHTIDPRNGRPVAHGLASVTVLHPRTMDADAYATALMVLGERDGYALAVQLGLPALFIEHGNSTNTWKTWATPSFERLRRPVQ